MRSSRKMMNGLAVALALACGGAWADEQPLDLPTTESAVEDLSQENDLAAEKYGAIEEGYREVWIADHYDSPQRAVIDDKFMSKIAPKGQIYGFAFANYDIDGDGFLDLILTPKGAQFEPPKGIDSPLTFVYLFNGKDWRLALTSGAMWVGAKPRDASEPNGAKDLAFAQQDSVLRYRLINGEFVEIK